MRPEPAQGPGRRAYALLLLALLLVAYHLGLILNTARPSTAPLPAAWRTLTIAASLLWIWVFVWSALGLWWKKHIQRRVLMFIMVFVVYNALRLSVFAQSEYDRQRLPFVWVVTVLIVVALFIIRHIRTGSMEPKEKDDDSKSKN